MASPVPTTAMMTAPQGVGALFSPKVGPEAQKRKKIADGLKRITDHNTSVAKSLQPQPIPGISQPVQPAPMDGIGQSVPPASSTFAGPQQRTPTPLLPAAQLEDPAQAAQETDPNAAMDQYQQNRLGSQEFRINRRHPAREQRGVGGPFAGRRVSEATSAVEQEFQGLGDDAKQGLVDQRQSMLFTPKQRPTAAAAGTPPPAAPAAPMAAPYKGFKNLGAPTAATGKPLGGATFGNLQKPRTPGSAIAQRRATGPRTARLA